MRETSFSILPGQWEQLSVEGAGSARRAGRQLMNVCAGCKWQYADKRDHLQMDAGRHGEGVRETQWHGAEQGGGFNPLRVSLSRRKQAKRDKARKYQYVGPAIYWGYEIRYAHVDLWCLKVQRASEINEVVMHWSGYWAFFFCTTTWVMFI